MPKKKKTIVSLVGARPQFVKLAPLAPVLSKKCNHLIVHSGQHYDSMMSAVFFEQLAIPTADYNLSVGSCRHGEMTARIMSRFEKLLLELRPDMVLVYGDTNSTLAGALTTAKLHIPVGHIEAGLRSYRMDMPEEINRRVTDHVSDLLFCPTSQAIANLKAEGVKKGLVRSGDLMYELLDRSRTGIMKNGIILKKYNLEKGDYILMTVHRAGNVDCLENMKKVVDILAALDKPVVFPVHPHTRKSLRKFELLKEIKKMPHVNMIEPVSYLDNLSLMYYAAAVMTDSGGIQKEAVFLGTKCLTMRDETEWTETLKWGNQLVGLSIRKIKDTLNNSRRSTRKVSYKIRNKRPSETITGSIAKYFKE